MQDECTLEIMNAIQKLWNQDKQIVDIDHDFVAEVNSNASTIDDDLKWLPLCTPEEIEHAKGKSFITIKT